MSPVPLIHLTRLTLVRAQELSVSTGTRPCTRVGQFDRTFEPFSPLQPLQDTNVAGYLRHAHEQNLISTIEEGRRETQEDFYRLLEDRSRKDWEAKKRRVFEELGGRSSSDSKALAEMKKSFRARGSLAVRDALACSIPLSEISG